MGEGSSGPVDVDRDHELNRTEDGELPMPEAAEARRDIERTRAEMSETIDAIQERLSPDNIKDQVMEQVREHVQDAKDAVREATIGKVENMMESAGDMAYEARRTVVDTIRENPLPAAIAGIGLGWLVMSAWSGAPNGAARSRRKRGRVGRQYVGERRYYQSGSVPYPNQRATSGPGLAEHAQTAVSRAKEAAGDAVEQAQDAIGDVVEGVRDTTGYYADQVQRQALHAGEFVQETWQETPLTIAAVALAVGAAVGFALPQTRKENELMGEARDSLLDKAQGIAGDAMQQVKTAADKIADQATPAPQPPKPPQPPQPKGPGMDPINKGI